MAFDREFCRLGVQRLAIVEFDARPQLDGHRLAVRRGFVGQRELRDDVEMFVDIEQLCRRNAEKTMRPT